MLRLTTRMTGLAGSPYFSTQFTSGVTDTEAQEAAQALENFWTAIAGYITSGLSIQVLPEVDLLEVPTGAVTDTFPTVTEIVASTGNAALPKATQGLVRLRTNTFLAGRRLQGRIFIPALANDAQITGIPSPGFLTDVAAAAEALRTALEPGSNDLGVWHRPSPGGSATDGAFGAVTSVSVWTQFAVLRSRRD